MAGQACTEAGPTLLLGLCVLPWAGHGLEVSKHLAWVLGAVGAAPPLGLLQPALRGDRREQAAEAGCTSEGGVPLQRPAGGEQ